MPSDPQPRCYYCKTTFRRDDMTTELRPYGPGGSPLCFRCMSDPAHPEREEQAKRAFKTQLSAAEVAGGGVSVLTDEGPNPATDDERELVRCATAAEED